VPAPAGAPERSLLVARERTAPPYLLAVRVLAAPPLKGAPALLALPPEACRVLEVTAGEEIAYVTLD
jgi:hypothetical protein